jgi:hypothetical protein
MLANLRALFGVVIDIVLLRRGPEHLPAAPALLAVVIALDLVVSAVLTGLMPNSPPTWPLQLVVGTAFLLLWFHVAFLVAQKRERFVQTMTAIFAASVLFMPVLVPLASALQPYFADAQSVKQPPGSIVLPAGLFAIWLLTVQVRIVRSAFEWRWFVSIIFIFAQNFMSAYLLGLLFGAPKPGP